MPQATLREIGQAGHIPHYEQPEEVNSILGEFLKVDI
jgi:pimeloyl-ACP methyl ester carboxylesterase